MCRSCHIKVKSELKIKRENLQVTIFVLYWNTAIKFARLKTVREQMVIFMFDYFVVSN